MSRTDVTSMQKTCTSPDATDMVFKVGGLMLIAGILARNKYLSLGALCAVVSVAVPDIVRYVKIRSM